jgi:hypothetical protein
MSTNATANLVRIPIVGVRGTAFVSGSWSLTLRDTTSATVRLNLNQYRTQYLDLETLLKDM